MCCFHLCGWFGVVVWRVICCCDVLCLYLVLSVLLVLFCGVVLCLSSWFCFSFAGFAAFGFVVFDAV